MTAKQLLVWSYDLKPYQVSGSVDSTDRYNVIASVKATASRQQVRIMLQSLLANRFSLRAHMERQTVSGYSMLADKGGLRKPPAGRSLAPEKFGGVAVVDLEDQFGPWYQIPGHFEITGRSGRMRLTGFGLSASKLAELVSQRLSAPVVDRTSISQTFDTVLYFVDEGSSIAPLTANPVGVLSQGAYSVGYDQNLAAALESQLGIKLEHQRVQTDVLVVDSMLKAPSEN
jgi:uncharacterized protein (TIGR03435 family)